MANQLSGRVTHIGETQQITSTFSKRDLIIISGEDTKYPEYFKLEATQDNTNLLDKVQLGDQVTCDYNLRGSKKEMTDKNGNATAFVQLSIWKITQVNSSAPAASKAPSSGGYDINDIDPEELAF